MPKGLGLCENESRVNRENGTRGTDASVPKSDLHFLEVYHISAMMCPYPDVVFTILTRFVLTQFLVMPKWLDTKKQKKVTSPISYMVECNKGEASLEVNNLLILLAHLFCSA